VAKHIDTFKGWSESIVGDVAALEVLIESAEAPAEARRLAAAALNYLLSRMDLVPDWEGGIGVLDDVMVLRVCANLASAHGFAGVPGEMEFSLARLGNEAEQIAEFLGTELYDKLRAFCADLIDRSVRGRAPATILADPAARAAMFKEVDEDVQRSVPVVVEDPDDAEIRLKAYLAHKLK